MTLLLNFLIVWYLVKHKDNFTLYLYFYTCFYGYETWSITLREEHRLKMFENRVLRRIF